MLSPLFAFRVSWVGVLILIGCGFVVWFAVRVVLDTITWIREEVIDDFRKSKRQRSKLGSKLGSKPGSRPAPAESGSEKDGR